MLGHGLIDCGVPCQNLLQHAAVLLGHVVFIAAAALGKLGVHRLQGPDHRLHHVPTTLQGSVPRQLDQCSVKDHVLFGVQVSIVCVRLGQAPQGPQQAADIVVIRLHIALDDGVEPFELQGHAHVIQVHDVGDGYSKMSKQEQVRVGNFIEEYLQTSQNIALIIFLIDIRHTPTQNDKLMYDYIFKTNLPCMVIASKADKIAVTKVNGYVEDLQKVLNPLHDLTFLPFSSERKSYTEDVWEAIEKILLK